MKIAVVYYSKHHGNTKKLLNAIVSAGHDLTLINAAEVTHADLAPYDVIGFASGIYYSKFHKSVLRLVENDLPRGKKVFFLYTYGAEKAGYTEAVTKAVDGKGAQVLGEYGCFGFNTFGPFKLIGGIAKGHPTADERRGAVQFFERVTAN